MLFVHICTFPYYLINAIFISSTYLSKIEELLILYLNLRNYKRKTFKFKSPLRSCNLNTPFSYCQHISHFPTFKWWSSSLYPQMFINKFGISRWSNFFCKRILLCHFFIFKKLKKHYIYIYKYWILTIAKMVSKKITLKKLAFYVFYKYFYV